MTPYNKYKPSGIEWIGEIPEHWEVKRLGALGQFSKGGNISKSNLIETDNGLPAILYGDIYTKYNIEAKDIVHKISEETANNSVEIHKGVLLFTGSGETKEDIGKCVVYNADYPAYAGGDLIIFTPKDTDGKFLSYSQNSALAIHQKAIAAKGEIIVHIYGANLRDVYMPYPPTLVEQTAIAGFLDRKTAEIDQLIAHKKRLLELYEEEKTAIINQAVTKGINPNATMKDSGIEWLGQIPEHWEVKKLKYCLTDKLKYGANESAEYENYEHPRYIRITDFGNDGQLKKDTFKSLEPHIASEYLLREGDILFARSGATVGKTFQFKNYKGEACFAGYLIKASADPNILLSDFLYFFTKSGTYDNWKNSIFNQATIQNIGADKYAFLEIPIPHLSEQQSIVHHIETQCAMVDSKIAIARRQIELCQEYRQALISEVVTGRVKVI